MTKFRNTRQKKYLKTFAARPSLEDINNDLTLRCKFNFSYFDSSQVAGQKFSDWTQKQLCDLLEKLKNYTTKPLSYWRNLRVGGGGLRTLAIYGGVPSKSEFKHPKFIPHQAQWGRFRLAYKIRLVGFTIPTALHNTFHPKTGEFFDKNTFYVVFLDENHMFYITEEK